jgi:hypothetical protein
MLTVITVSLVGLTVAILVYRLLEATETKE